MQEPVMPACVVVCLPSFDTEAAGDELRLLLVDRFPAFPELRFRPAVRFERAQGLTIVRFVPSAPLRGEGLDCCSR